MKKALFMGIVILSLGLNIFNVVSRVNEVKNYSDVKLLNEYVEKEFDETWYGEYSNQLKSSDPDRVAFYVYDETGEEKVLVFTTRESMRMKVIF